MPDGRIRPPDNIRAHVIKQYPVFLQKKPCSEQHGMGTHILAAWLCEVDMKVGCPFCSERAPLLPYVSASELLIGAEVWRSAQGRNTRLPQCKRSTLLFTVLVLDVFLW